MDINGIRGALGVRPFLPLVIRLADGRGLQVPLVGRVFNLP
jgi:hypothetical protein